MDKERRLSTIHDLTIHSPGLSAHLAASRKLKASTELSFVPIDKTATAKRSDSIGAPSSAKPAARGEFQKLNVNRVYVRFMTKDFRSILSNFRKMQARLRL